MVEEIKKKTNAPSGPPTPRIIEYACSTLQCNNSCDRDGVRSYGFENASTVWTRLLLNCQRDDAAQLIADSSRRQLC